MFVCAGLMGGERSQIVAMFQIILSVGRTVQVRVASDHFSYLLQLAVEVGFDWVYYASHDYVRLSAIPDGE